MDDSPLDQPKFKLLPPSEREYAELSPEEVKKRYKNPESTTLQYNNRIKYRVINAIIEMAWLSRKLHKDQLEKIFTWDNCMVDFVETTLRGLKIYYGSWEQKLSSDETMQDEWKERAGSLRPLLQGFDEFLLDEVELTERNQLLEKFRNSYSNIRLELEALNSSILRIENEKNWAIDCLRRKGLLDECREERRSSLKGIVRKRLREKGYTEEKIEEVLEYTDLVNHILAGRHDQD